VPSIFYQISKGLEYIKEGFVNLCEHDILYPHEYFKHYPPVLDEKEKVCFTQGNMIRSSPYGFYPRPRKYPLSNQSAFCKPLLANMYKRISMIKNDTFSKSVIVCEIGRNKWEKNEGYRVETFECSKPCVDIRHGTNVSREGVVYKQDMFSETDDTWGSNTALRTACDLPCYPLTELNK
jgi:hypothetical protein